MNKVLNDKTIRLCGQDIEIVCNDPKEWANGGMGQCSEKQCKILVHSAMVKSAIDSTILHEIVHLILNFNGFHNESANEQLVSVLGNSFLALIRDNPEFIKDLI